MTQQLPEPDYLQPDDPCYPRILVRRLGRFTPPPPPLFCCGDLPSTMPRLLAVVGTRGATMAAVAATTELARVACKLGFGIVSGGAIGIDAAAHRGAVDAGGLTIAVLGSGLRQLYPQRNVPLFQEIISSGTGALLTPFASDAPPRRGHFIARNRLVAAMAEAVVVAEAPLRSGALNTARQARELEIPVLAMPGSAGTRALIASGAIEIRRAEDIEAALAGRLRRGSREPEDPDLRAIAAVLTTNAPLTIDAVAARCEMSVPRAAAALLRLEVDGWVRMLPRGYLLAADPSPGQ